MENELLIKNKNKWQLLGRKEKRLGIYKHFFER